MSELLGKETLDTNTYGKSTGRSGNYSTNYQITGRELLTPDEVRLLDNRYALLFIRGERPIMDEKIDILRHPNVALTTDGKAAPYKHGEITEAVASLAIQTDGEEVTATEFEANDGYILLSDEDMDTFIENHKEEHSNEESV